MALLFVLFVFQYLFLWVLPALGLPALRALHAVNALALFWLAERLAKRVWHMNRSTRRTLRRDPAAPTAA